MIVWSIFINNGGKFNYNNYKWKHSGISPKGSKQIAVFDFNRDGAPDLIFPVSRNNKNYIYILYNKFVGSINNECIK